MLSAPQNRSSSASLQPSFDVPEHSREEWRRENGLSILVVEDSADTAESYAVLLGLRGDAVRLARTGSEALTACREAQAR
jgi:hypothetical protein